MLPSVASSLDCVALPSTRSFLLGATGDLGLVCCGIGHASPGSVGRLAFHAFDEMLFRPRLNRALRTSSLNASKVPNPASTTARRRWRSFSRKHIAREASKVRKRFSCAVQWWILAPNTNRLPAAYLTSLPQIANTNQLPTAYFTRAPHPPASRHQ